MRVGDLVRFRTGRKLITRDITWDTGLILEIFLDDFDGGDKCKILDSSGRIKLIRAHGTEVLNHNETR